ncbi:hypothetical protein LDL08_34285 [Nonomuraea glycinis]|uniref:Uncharacterized protein n=1 Tax=Nonomuraea glycinis TaxID=2047744 RepID=A0A918ADH0_9ACTN|nr:hypothetical protein [Nonomuraea glycinis]MCA2181253.1 hypothetical protein [Nonomuraea glycinis]GGP13351.1 hypothetical protein GCM10012278_64770 [Nonomuraea glycinis]
MRRVLGVTATVLLATTAALLIPPVRRRLDVLLIRTTGTTVRTHRKG